MKACVQDDCLQKLHKSKLAEGRVCNSSTVGSVPALIQDRAGRICCTPVISDDHSHTLSYVLVRARKISPVTITVFDETNKHYVLTPQGDRFYDETWDCFFSLEEFFLVLLYAIYIHLTKM